MARWTYLIGLIGEANCRMDVIGCQMSLVDHLLDVDGRTYLMKHQNKDITVSASYDIHAAIVMFS